MYCPFCGAQIPDSSRQCMACNAPLAHAQSDEASEIPEGIGLLIPIRPAPCSLISGYIGLLGWFLCRLPGPVAIVLGIIGLKRLKQNARLNGRPRAWTGIVLGFLQTALIVFVVVMSLTP